MSEAQSTAPTAANRHQRSARNYLLDRNFQLKYTGILVGVAFLLSIALGGGLWWMSSKVIEQSQRAVEQGREMVRQGQETVDRGKEVLVQSRKVSQVVAMNIAKEYEGDPELAKTFSEAAAKDEDKLKKEQERLERDALSLSQRARELEAQAKDIVTLRQTLLLGLIAGLTLLVVAVGLLGIVFTHKVAGPIFKMKRLLRQVGSGKLVVRERLRRGDELQHFFEAFERMVEDLRARQMAEISKVDRILSQLSDAPLSSRGLKEVDEDGVQLLKQLRHEMQDQLDA
jgi:nitrogen fixation/metabolism regulation signal transduction histidine kinase